jgi:hypothetical protein
LEIIMTGGSTPQFEIPTDMRKMIDRCVEQVRTGISNYLQLLQRAVPGNVMGGSELTNKVLNYAERNLARAFEFAGKLAQVRDVQTLARVQVEFIQEQIQAITEQTKDLSEGMTTALTDSMKTTPKGGLSS